MNDLSEQATMPPPPTIPYGYCGCGCNEKTPLIERNRFTQGLVKGTPRKFLVGHQKRLPRAVSEFVTIAGVTYRTIPLTKNQFAIVDVEEYERLAKYVWYAHGANNRSGFYAARDETRDGKKVTVFLHQEVLGKTDDREIDHRDGNGLHNWRLNLRHATHLQNLWNVGLNKQSKSGFRGVHFISRLGKYMGTFKVNGEKVYVGLSDDPAALSVEVERAILEHRGDFAVRT